MNSIATSSGSRTVSSRAVTAAAIGGAYLGAMISMIACVTTTPKKKVIDTPIVCTLFDPISLSEKDTEETQEQVLVYNRVWIEFCEDYEANE